MNRLPTRRRAPRNLSLLLAMGAVAGLLLWAKLRLVSNMPRSVYADPKAAHRLPPAPSGAARGPAGEPAPR